jgi:hypothetical protein
LVNNVQFIFIIFKDILYFMLFSLFHFSRIESNSYFQRLIEMSSLIIYIFKLVWIPKYKWLRISVKTWKVLSLSLLIIKSLSWLLIKWLIILLICMILILKVSIRLIYLLIQLSMILSALTQKYFVFFEKLNYMSDWRFLDVPIQRL